MAVHSPLLKKVRHIEIIVIKRKAILPFDLLLIGEKVMHNLKDLDQVAYVRFASIYREFKDVNTFMDELKKMLDK